MSSPTVLFYTDNGLGLGHLTRQAAIATHAHGGFKPVFLTMSAGYPLLRGLGLPAEYFPSYGRLGITKRDWEPMVAARILEMARLVKAGVLVVDHVSPPMIFDSLRATAPGLKLVWVRRGLWQLGKNAGALRNGAAFDLIIEPGDLAAPVDQGATVARRHETIRTEPVVLTDRRDFLPRDQARDHLGIPRSGRAVLINLGDADPTEIGRFITHTATVISEAASDEIHLFAPLHPLHGEDIPKDGRVIMAPVYPTSRYLNAFDAVVSTSGYNSFHEIMGSGLPAVFIPHSGASIDDQRRRAEFAALSGRAHWAPDVFDKSFETAIRRMLRSSEPKIANDTTEILGGLNGAREIAEILANIAAEAQVDWTEPIADDTQPTFGPQTGDTGRTGGRLVVALQHNDSELTELAATLSPADLTSSVFVVRDGTPKRLYDLGAVFESMLTEADWQSIGRPGYEHFLESRFGGVVERYRLTRTMAPVAAMTPPQADRNQE